MYAVIPYAIAQGATEIPWALAQTILFTCISYWMIHFDFTAGELPVHILQFTILMLTRLVLHVLTLFNHWTSMHCILLAEQFVFQDCLTMLTLNVAVHQSE